LFVFAVGLLFLGLSVTMATGFYLDASTTPWSAVAFIALSFAGGVAGIATSIFGGRAAADRAFDAL
jgi:hypothetical protein